MEKKWNFLFSVPKRLRVKTMPQSCGREGRGLGSRLAFQEERRPHCAPVSKMRPSVSIFEELISTSHSRQGFFCSAFSRNESTRPRTRGEKEQTAVVFCAAEPKVAHKN